MAPLRALAFALLCAVVGAVRVQQGTSASANPIRRVVGMLQTMQKKIQAEGKQDEKIFEKFMCYCRKGSGELEETIAAAQGKIPQVQSALETAKAAKVQLEDELEKHKKDRADAKDSIAKAKELRKKENAEYGKVAADLEANIAAVSKATTAVVNGMAGSFLQTPEALKLRNVAINADLSVVDRNELASFLSESSTSLGSGQIVGILKQLKESMERDLHEASGAEAKAQADFESMVSSTKKEVAANDQAIEAKLLRSGELGVEIENLKEDLEDTTEALEQDKNFVGNLATDCQKKGAEYEAIKKARADELVAIAETIKILNDDDALDLFKKTLPTPSLLQMQVTSKEVKQQALKMVREAQRSDKSGHRDFRLDFISLALSSKKVNFDKVVSMIDHMIKLLNKEQVEDDSKKTYCEKEADSLEDEAKALKQQVSDLEKAVKDAGSTLATLTEDISALEKGIRDLDQQVAEATQTRQEEHKASESAIAASGAAKELLQMGKKRLNQFYNPKLAPSFLQMSKRSNDAAPPPPPPEAVGAYQKKGEQSAGVLSMIDMLIADVDKELQETKIEEKDAQAEYEQLIQDSADKRAADAKSMEEKEAAKADMESDLEKGKIEKKAKFGEVMAKDREISDLHQACDWLISNYGTRKTARANEIESLKNAKAALSGADYSLLQSGRSLVRRPWHASP